jgi:enediyne biosynthesis protein E4
VHAVLFLCCLRILSRKGMRNFFYLIGACIFFQCSPEDKKTLFKPAGAEVTGINFSNSLTYGDTLSVLDFEYMYNGGGVAIGDINNDGLQDIYFTGNMVSSRLYLNKGDLKFEDITTSAGVGTTTWANGVAMMDINQDGYRDIYVSVGGNRNTPETQRANILFINNGNNTFTESAARYGLADQGYGIQSAFFDYDLDGDLDMYLLRNAFVSYSRNNSRPKQVKGEALSTDKLFRNNGDHTFTDVSKEAGITIEGFGLGLVICDINEDGWPDVYVSNDFITNDLLYINNRDGTFTNKISAYLKHQTFNGMGADVADYNNDGLQDIVVLDMLPEDNKRWKLTPRGNTYDEFHNGLRQGYEPQYVRNTLQLNNGNGSFSEIGQLAGIEATEWSWSALFADFDNDGLKDLFISNGYGKDITNLDFIVYGDTEQAMGLPAADRKERQAMLNELPGIKIHNYIYRNRGDLTFSDQSSAWGLSAPTYSNGAAYTDLDNDGDLDLVTNNIDEKASILESQLINKESAARSNYLRIAFSGPPPNREGFGAKVIIRHRGAKQYQYFNPVRGYLSSVEPFIHFGLDSVRRIDTVEVVWPDGKYQLIENVMANQVLTVDYKSSTIKSRPEKIKVLPLFEEVTGTNGIDYIHRENSFVDFKVQPILPHMHSRNGPGITVGDVNNDGMEDFYVGGASGFSGALFLQDPDGNFDRRPITGIDSTKEDMGVLFFDADNDSDLDLYVTSGGSEHPKGSRLYHDNLYINNGKGQFKDSNALPDLAISGSCVVASDYDQDDDLDLFVGGRVSAGEFPMPAASVLLRNDSRAGSLRFTDVTAEIAPEINQAGMVCSALWTDYDSDGWIDLILSGEFLPIRFYHNENGKFVDATEETGLKDISGWWNSLVGGDFDNDGDTDYVAGNLGLNSHFHATPAEPLCIHASDYNKDGRIDPVMSYYVQGEEYVGHPRDQLIDQINSMRNRFRTYTSYAEATFEESFKPEELKGAYVVCARRFESSYIENLGKGNFRISSLPLHAQFAPIYGMVVADYDQDGNLDILAAGNSYAPEVFSGRDDASIGWYLKGDGKGEFTSMHVTASGFMADKDSKGMANLGMADGGDLIIVANNDGPLRTYLSAAKSKHYKPHKNDAYAIVSLSDGRSYRHEFYYGSTYLSQSSRALKLHPDIVSLTVVDNRNKSRTIDLKAATD